MGVAVDFAEAGVLSTAAMSVVFVVVYTLVAPWWRHEVGRTIVAFDASIFLALLPSALHYTLGLGLQHVFFAWYYGSSLMAAALITAWRTVVIVRVQRRARSSPGAGA